MAPRRTKCAGLLLLVAVFAITQAAESQAPSTSASDGSFQAFSEATVFVATPDRVGSGFFIDGTGTLLTSHYVVWGSSMITVKLRNGQTLPARILASNATLDVAVLSVGRPTSAWLTMGSISDQDETSDIAVLGAARDADWSVTTGIVKGIRAFGADRLIQIRASINAGNRGGPVVLRRCGVAIGVVRAKQRDAEGLAFAVDAGSIQRAFPKYIPKLLDRCEPATPGGSREASSPPRPPAPAPAPSPAATPSGPSGESRPSTGTVLSRRMASSGHGEMNIANQLTFDAVVTLRSILDKTPALSLYVRAGEHTSITDVVDGEYEVLYRVGEGWTGVDFARLVGAFQLNQPLAFAESFVVMRRGSGSTVKRVPSEPWNIVLRRSDRKR